MTENSDENSSSSNSRSPTVGERLQVAREAKKITITEVVAQLRLTKETIVYLESDQWDKLHGRPYARGYFSNYVTFLGLPHDEMLALFNLEYTSTEPSIDGFKRTEPIKHGGVGLGWLKAVFVLVIIGIVAWYAYQYWLEMQSQTQAIETPINSFLSAPDKKQNINNDSSGQFIEELPPIQQSEPLVEGVIVPEQENDLTSLELSEQVNDTIEGQVEDSSNNESTTIEDVVAETNSLERLLSEQNNDILTLQATDIETVEQTDNKENILSMQFTGDCWVEIRDRNNKNLLHKIALAGETVEISGDWPLHVILGNASAVTVNYNNTAFDIDSFTRKNVARFSVGEDIE